jgi:hypothetical protein
VERKIFVRERTRIKEGTRPPRFAVVGVLGADLNFQCHHLRKREIEEIGRQAEAEVIYLPGGEGEGKRRRRAEPA